VKVALVYDRINKWGGAERVLLTLHEIFPDAPLYTSLYQSKAAKWAEVFPKVIPSRLNKIRFLRDKHEYLAILMPLIFEKINLDGYDLVISVTSEFAKNINTKGKHICYCLTPTRYLWSGYDEYFRNDLLKPVVDYLRKKDLDAARKPDEIIAISTEVQRRIRKYYKRNSKIIFPPVELRSHRKNSLLRGPRQGGAASRGFLLDACYFLIVSRLVKYKKIDLAINAFNQLNKPLYIVGVGREEKYLKSIANKNIKFLGQVNDERLAKLYVSAKALIFPQNEDFGIVAVEAQSFGCPVIAFAEGGARDTVNSKTGMFFEKQAVDSLVSAVKKFEKKKFKKSDLVKNARKFSESRFKREFLKFVKDVC
jgi:glycosyltransferase involved in cell wall biosynthesis